jgi:hypothetical protein
MMSLWVDELVGTVRDEGREILLLPLSREAADECVSSPQYQHLEPVGVTVKDIETVCRNHRLDLVALCGLEPEELAIVSIETVPLILLREVDENHEGNL